jgi:predicted amidohydrolase YtcJ
VVLDGDVFAEPAAAIASHRVAATYVAGSPVYRAG